jgi:hypothetical protein
MSEKRKQVRAPVSDYFIVFYRHTDEIIGRIMNMTEEGMMIVSEMPAKVSGSFHCRMALPEKLMDKSQVLFDAECRWSEKNQKTGMFESGFQIRQVSDMDKQIISLLLQKWMNVKTGAPEI